MTIEIKESTALKGKMYIGKLILSLHKNLFQLPNPDNMGHGTNWDVKITWKPFKVNNKTPEFKYLSEVLLEQSMQSHHRKGCTLLIA